MKNSDDNQPLVDEDFRLRIEQRIQNYNPDKGLIDLSECGIGDETIDWVMSQLRLIDGLTTLDIGHNKIRDAGVFTIVERLRALTTLDIEDNAIGEAGAVAIAEHLAALTTLNIANNSIGEAGAVAIAEHLTALMTLRIWNNKIGETGAVAIAEHLPALTTLDIGSNEIGEPGALAIAKNLTALTTLGIETNNIRDAGVVTIAEHLTALTTLDIWNNEISETGAVAIAEYLTALTILNIRNNEIGETGAVAIAEHLATLTTLDIRNNKIGKTGAVAIAEHLTALTTLDIGSNEIGDAGAVAIAEHLAALTTLGVETNNIREAGAVAIAEHLTELTILKIGNNEIGETGAVAIAKDLTELTTLNIQNNKIGETGAVAIAYHLTALTTLRIWNNKIGMTGAVAIAQYLTELTTLDISSNEIREPGAIAIAEHLTALTTLDIRNNKIGERGAIAIAEHLTALTTLHIGKNEIREAGTVAIAKQLTALTRLDIGANKIHDAAVVIALLQKLVRPNAQGGLVFIDVRSNPLGWTGMDAPISEETLKQKNPAKLRQLLLDSQLGMGEDLIAARATMTGLGMSGKTRLSRWLVDHPKKKHDIDLHDRTIGIEPLETKISGKRFAHPTLGKIILTILDCGGQQEQLQSHHNLVYKASGRSLFILCLHAGKDFRSRDGNRAVYYLRMLQSYRAYGDRPLPVLIVVTHGELTGTPARKLYIPTESELLEQYPQLRITTVDPYLGCVGKEIKHVQRAIVEFMAKMPEIRALLPKGILKIRDALHKKFQLDEPLPPDPRELRIKYPSLSPEWFSEVCIEQGLTEESLHGDYLRHLASLGTVIAPGVEKTVSADVKRLDSVVSEIFNPRYVNQYVYGLLMNNRVREQKGFMSESQFREETTRLTETKRDALLKLLKKYLVVFEWKHEDEAGLLIPDLLPERMTPAKWDDQICGTALHFRSVFLGEPRFFEFLSKHKAFIKPLDLNEVEGRMAIRPIGVFRNEVCIRKEPCEALVQIDVIESRIDISVRGGTMEEATHLREQIVGNLTHHDHASLGQPREGDAVVIERWQDDPREAWPKPTAVDKGKYDLAELQERIEGWVKRHGFPWPQRLLAIYFRCPENSLSVIVNRSEPLQAAREEQKQLRAAPGRKHQDIEGAVLNGTKNLKAHDPKEEAAVQEEYHSIIEFSRDQIISELCTHVPKGKKQQDAQKVIAHETTEFLRSTLAWQRVNSREA